MNFLFYFILFYSSGILANSLILSPGERLFLKAPSNQKVRIGDKSLVLIDLEGLNLSLLAKKKGQTLLVVGEKRYKLFILEDSLKTKALYIDQLLKKLKGLKWSLSPSQKFQILGELYRFSDWLDLKKAFDKYNFEYEFKARMDEELKNISSFYFKKNLKKPFEILWDELPLVFIPQDSYLSVYQRKLKPFGLFVKEQKNWFFKADFLQIDLAIVENLSSSFLQGGGLNQNLLSFSSMLSFLNFLKSSGQGKSLHHSSVLVQSGKTLELESGGQIPFTSFNLKSEQETTSWKSHGFKLNLKPQVGVKNQIQLHFHVRLSEPLAFKTGSSAPPLKNQTLQTEIVLEAGQIFKLFGLKKKHRSQNFKGSFSFVDEFNSFIGGKNNSDMNQTVFIQIQLLNSLKKVSKKERDFFNETF
ncbi:MAG: hypothetical protein GDA46_05440 [Bdellovibrionales bacterium]|nr:hypothetical protein [Bdellovibrionales bacterium]